MTRHCLLFLGFLIACLAGSGCGDAGADADDDEEAGETSNALGTWRDQAVRANNLRDGEIVLTFDDGPARSSAEVASLLRARGHVGLFFVVSKHLGTVTNGSPRLDDAGVAKLRAVVDAGQVVGNHSHDHCIGGASACGGRAFADLAAEEQRRQIETTDLLLRSALARVDRAGAYLPFFRPPGNSWSARTAANVRTANVPAQTYGPVAWDLPVAGEEDFRCWSSGLGVEACAARYVRAFRAMPRGGQRAVILVHDNFADAPALTRQLLDSLVGTRTKAGNAVRVVHPRCIVGCTR